MADSSLLLATFYAISERNRARQQNQPVPTAEPNLHGQLHETATWHTKSVSSGGTRSQSEHAASSEFTGMLEFYWSSFLGALGRSKLETFVLNGCFHLELYKYTLSVWGANSIPFVLASVNFQIQNRSKTLHLHHSNLELNAWGTKVKAAITEIPRAKSDLAWSNTTVVR